MTTPDSISGSRVLVLGGSGVLGGAIAGILDARGARVALAGRDRAKLDASAAGLAQDPVVVEFDFQNPAGFEDALDSAISALGGLDGVINAAGVVGFGPLSDTPEQAIDELIEVDFAGPLKFMRSAVPRMSDGGFWVNITGVVAEQPMAGLATYAAAKAGLSAASTALMRELRRTGIRVIDARPPHTETGLAGRPIVGVAPPLPQGLEPEVVASRIITAIDRNEREVPSTEFAS